MPTLKINPSGLSIDFWQRVTYWLGAGDTSPSSKHIAQILLGIADRDTMQRGYFPRDMDDFASCLQLLEEIPEFKSRLHEVGESNPDWAPFLQNWDQLTALYLRDKDARTSNELFRVLFGCGPYSKNEKVAPAFRLTALSGDGLAFLTHDTLLVSKGKSGRIAQLMAPLSPTEGVLAIPQRFFPLLPEGMPAGMRAFPSTVSLYRVDSTEQHALVVGTMPFQLQLGETLVQINSAVDARVAPCVVTPRPVPHEEPHEHRQRTALNQ